jgi:hypothetical protein
MKLPRIGTYTALASSLLALALPKIAFGAGGLVQIIPTSGVCNCDTAPDWGCVLQVLQNVITDAVFLGVILCVIWIAYGGFSLMLSAGNPESISQSKIRIMNALVGIAVILCSWLVIDFVMKAVYDPESAFDGQNFGPWNSILAPSGDDYCIKQTTPQAITAGTIGIITGVTPGTSAGVGAAKGLCADSNTACSPAVMKSEGLSDAQANAMSCIAVTESGGNPHIGGSGTGAEGLFQITATNWRNAAYHSGSCSVNSSRDDATCNRQAAVLMFKHVGYQPWTGMCKSSGGCGNVSYGQYWNPNAVACVAKYDPGH